MRMRKSERKRSVAWILIFVLLISCGMPGAQVWAEEVQNEPVVTQVKGVCKSFNRSVSGTIKDEITVTPARKTEIRLQYYNAGKKKWQTKARIAMRGTAESEKITLQYPSQWKKKGCTSWRIYIPASEGYQAYIFDTIQITSKNIASMKLASKSAVIIRADTGKVLYTKKKDKRLPNASTTKMMTALLCLENNDLSKVVKISKNAAKTPYGCLHSKAGNKFYVKDLLTAMLVRSSNDSATALGEYTGGTVKKFAKMMTRRAKELGCKNTNFVNPHGLHHKKHYSSAYDLSLIHREVLKYEMYRSIILKKSYTFKNVKKTERYKVYTTDELLGKYKGFLGGKTGYTEEAGCCFSGAYTYKGVTYIYTVLGSKTSKGRWNDCKKMMQYIRKYCA